MNNLNGPRMDLSTTFDSLYHELLIEKWEAYGFRADSLRLILNYLKGCHRSKWKLYIIYYILYLI